MSALVRTISKTAIIDRERYPFDGLGHIRSKDDFMLLISPSIAIILIERLGCSSSSPAIVRKLPKL